MRVEYEWVDGDLPSSAASRDSGPSLANRMASPATTINLPTDSVPQCTFLRNRLPCTTKADSNEAGFLSEPIAS